MNNYSAKPSLLERFTCNFDPSVIAKTVTQICNLARMEKKERLDYLRDHEAFPSRYLWGRADEDRLNDGWLLRLAHGMCKARGLPLPDEVKRYPIEELLITQTRIFRKGHMATADYLNEVEVIRAHYGVEPKIMVEILQQHLAGAARCVARQHGLPPGQKSQDELPFTNQACNNNRQFHDLGMAKRMIKVESKSESEDAMASIRKSEFVVAHVTANTKKYWQKELTLLAIGTDDAVIITVINVTKPYHLEDFMRKMKNVTVGRKILVKDMTNFRDLTRRTKCDFSNAVDADGVARKANWSDVHWQEFCRQLTAGDICMRASVMASRVRPSEIALEHERSRLALLHMFFKKHRNLIGGSARQSQGDRGNY